MEQGIRPAFAAEVAFLFYGNLKVGQFGLFLPNDLRVGLLSE